MRNAHLYSAAALYDEVIRRTRKTEQKVYLFFDEIQEVDAWEKCIHSLRVDLDCDIYITDSNARLLSGELATYLAGRFVELVIYPFSFSEFIELYRTTGADLDVREAVIGENQKDINIVLENIFFMELMRRGYVLTVGKVAGKEIDFVCVKQKKVVYSGRVFAGFGRHDPARVCRPFECGG